jgi:hypothetical protein
LNLPPTARSLVFKAYLRYLASTSKPIVIGPFRSELGFEVLYWLPLLNWALKTYGISEDRCIALSRGGMGAFYPAKHHVDLYALRSVDEVRRENATDYESTRLQKQTVVTAWDKQVAGEAVTSALGIRRAGTVAGVARDRVRDHHLLHPSWMYWLFHDYWEDQATIQHIAKHCEFSPLPVPSLPEGFSLPEKYVAVRFYERHTFPLHEQVKEIATGIVQALAAEFPVVLLNQKIFADDHTDLPITGPNIYTLPTVAPEQNFVLQAAVLARSQAFVGTYGGVAQWALRYQKPSLSFYTEFSGTAFAHRNLSQLMAARMGVPFEVADMRALRLWQAALKHVLPEKVGA